MKKEKLCTIIDKICQGDYSGIDALRASLHDEDSDETLYLVLKSDEANQNQILKSLPDFLLADNMVLLFFSKEKAYEEYKRHAISRIEDRIFPDDWETKKKSMSMREIRDVMMDDDKAKRIGVSIIRRKEYYCQVITVTPWQLANLFLSDLSKEVVIAETGISIIGGEILISRYEDGVETVLRFPKFKIFCGENTLATGDYIDFYWPSEFKIPNSPIDFDNPFCDFSYSGYHFIERLFGGERIITGKVESICGNYAIINESTSSVDGGEFMDEIYIAVPTSFCNKSSKEMAQQWENRFSKYFEKAQLYKNRFPIIEMENDRKC